jgi:hypothetical protein
MDVLDRAVERRADQFRVLRHHLGRRQHAVAYRQRAGPGQCQRRQRRRRPAAPARRRAGEAAAPGQRSQRMGIGAGQQVQHPAFALRPGLLPRQDQGADLPAAMPQGQPEEMRRQPLRPALGQAGRQRGGGQAMRGRGLRTPREGGEQALQP